VATSVTAAPIKRRWVTDMKLMTKAILKAVPPIGTYDMAESKDIPVIAKFFNPCGRYMSEYDPESGIAFGFVRGEFDETCDELGSFSIPEMEAIKLPPFGLGIERDIYFGSGHTLAEVMRHD